MAAVPSNINYTLYLKYFLLFIVMILISILLIFGAIQIWKLVGRKMEEMNEAARIREQEKLNNPPPSPPPQDDGRGSSDEDDIMGKGLGKGGDGRMQARVEDNTQLLDK